MRRIAGAVGPWSAVDAPELPAEIGTAPGRAAAAMLREGLGAATAAEVWVDCLWARFSKVAAEAYPRARVVLYEDGLHTYVPAEDHHVSARVLATDPRRGYRALRERLRGRLRPDDLGRTMRPRHLARVSASYLWIGRTVPLPPHQRRLPWVQMETRHVREVIDRAAAAAPAAAPAGDGPRALALGQCFANYGDLDRDEELAGYVEMAERLRGAGYQVLWKEHPRATAPAYPAVAAAVPGVALLPDLGPWPVELFVERLGVSACASVTSTSLFSIPELFGLPSYSPAARFLPLLRHPNDAMARLVSACVPPLPGPRADVQRAS
jgi:hypothetical protein